MFLSQSLIFGPSSSLGVVRDCFRIESQQKTIAILMNDEICGVRSA